ncbi:MAG: hypothetical protein IIC74_02585 [Bacteroidetes bacterium]|nr:hypothetical protein [Bacteroidota bacterium]
MKNLIILLSLAFVSTAQCQITDNIITPTEYNNIEINGIKLIDIKNTLGNQNAIESLLGTATNINIDMDGNSFDFNGFHIGFSAIISDGTYDSPILAGFRILNNSSNITIRGITVTIGSNISLLGNVVFGTSSINGEQFISYMDCNGCNNFIMINFNQTTNIITAIYYIEMT